MDWALAAAGFGVGGVVGLTGMGGGALMTPILVLFFGIPPLAAVSSDLVASAVMKPVGSAVHIKRGRVDWRLVRWLCLGSVPAAFAGVMVARALGNSENVHHVVQVALGIALFLAVLGLFLRAVMRLREQASGQTSSAETDSVPRVKVRPAATVIVGAIGGLVVGMTSVGSGSLIIVALLALYPLLRPNDLVGTDLVQAVPLVAAAALGHLLFGDFQFDVTTALLAGSIPGVFLGAQISSRAPGGLIRRALGIVLIASGLKLLGASNIAVVIGVAAAIILGSLTWMALRRHYGLPALPRRTATPPAAAPPPTASPDTALPSAVPSGTVPSGAALSGAVLSGAASYGAVPSGAAATGAASSDVASSGAVPSGAAATSAASSDAASSGAASSGAAAISAASSDAAAISAVSSDAVSADAVSADAGSAGAGSGGGAAELTGTRRV